ncbi:MAG: DUF885 domain-containing protein [Pseudomonadota bacterium]
MKSNLLSAAAIAALLLSGCGEGGVSDTAAPPPAQQGAAEASTETRAEAVAAESQRLDEWFAARWEEELDFSPLTKTFLGRKEDNDKVDDLSEAAEDRELAWRRNAVAEMRTEFDYDLLNDEAKTSYDLFAFELARDEAASSFRRRVYVFNQMVGPHAQLPNFLINFHSVETGDDMRAYVTRIGGVSRAIGEALERAQVGADEGVHAPLFAYEGALAQSRALVTGAPFEGDGDAPLWADANKKIDGLLEAGAIDEAEAQSLRDDARAALVDAFKPAYDELIAWLEADMANSPDIATGVGSLPDGEGFYRERLSNWTTTEMTPDEVHELGLAEVARIRAEMEAIKDRVEFTGSLQEFFTFVREDDQFYYPNTDDGREAYLQAARDHLAFIEDRLPDYFGLLPEADLVVKRVEAFRERDGGAQHYFPGTPDGSRPGIFYAHLSDMKAMPIPQLEVIAYHEGNPGHHMQNSIAQEAEDLPEFRNQANFGAYGEGWALYSELLAKEMGAYEDPYSDFGRLTTEIWRAIRLVVDTGLHAKGWTEEESVAYFTANSPAAAGQIKSEVQRYIVIPGQATSYKVGMIKIQELRAKAEAVLGDDFDIRGFHDTVLGGGALPLSLLETRIDAWIESESQV